MVSLSFPFQGGLFDNSNAVKELNAQGATLPAQLSSPLCLLLLRKAVLGERLPLGRSSLQLSLFLEPSAKNKCGPLRAAFPWEYEAGAGGSFVS